MDWYTLDEENKKDGHYRRKPAEIFDLEIEFENAVTAFQDAWDRHELNPTEASRDEVSTKLDTMLSLEKQLREARRRYHAKK